jgi:serine protease inhibitor
MPKFKTEFAVSIPTEEPIVFKADKPFTYFIRDNANGEILFMGEYAYIE